MFLLGVLLHFPPNDASLSIFPQKKYGKGHRRSPWVKLGRGTKSREGPVGYWKKGISRTATATVEGAQGKAVFNNGFDSNGRYIWVGVRHKDEVKVPQSTLNCKGTTTDQLYDGCEPMHFTSDYHAFKFACANIVTIDWQGRRRTSLLRLPFALKYLQQIILQRQMVQCARNII